MTKAKATALPRAFEGGADQETPINAWKNDDLLMSWGLVALSR
jgi:hypothetical protein